MRGIKKTSSVTISPDVTVCIGSSGDCSWVWVERCGHAGAMERYWDGQDAERAFRFRIENEKRKVA